MKRTALVSGPIRCALLLVALALSAAVCPAQTRGNNGVRAEIATLLDAHDEALNRHNLEGVLALFVPGPKTVLLGTGPGERYQGADEIRAAYKEFFKDFDEGTLKHSCYWKEGGANGNVVWGAAMCKFSDSVVAKQREYEMNVSAVAEKRGGKWQFVMLHFSNLTGGSAQGQ
jgi:hypothetical protein